MNSPHPRTDAIITQIIADGGELTPAHRALVDYTRRLESALSDLYDEQNDPPLLHREAEWEHAMAAARELLGYNRID